ncbi:DUF4097 family beta strand repeat-containing protein [Sporosarcina sp. 179-K 3D1 HS]|uniref:DUF4097 family beta strand repeat-containing protein n=1 Tax=Sporosarcina sp. 179-K 3D1 HS TaxID=3232169 RepID=UPI0039A1B927
MTENEFISRLEAALKPLPVEERDDIVQDIREYFTEGREDGKTDEELADSLGSPQEIAKELLAHYPLSETERLSDPTTEVISISDDRFSKADIQIQHGSLHVMPTDSSITTIELIGASEKLFLSAEVHGETLRVRLKNRRRWMFLFPFKPVHLHVKIPQKIYQSIMMKTENGRITGEKLLIKQINAQTSNGRIHLSESAASSLIAVSGNGRIELANIQSDEVRAKTDNGRVEMRNIDAERVSAESDNGRIVLEHVGGAITGMTNNGRLVLKTNTIDCPIDLQTQNGSIVVESWNKPTNALIQARTHHGKIEIFGQRTHRKIFGAGDHLVRLQSSNGRIIVV